MTESNQNACVSADELMDKISYLQSVIGEYQEETDKLKEIISYLPKVPAMPYEKLLAVSIRELQNENQQLRDKIELLQTENIAYKEESERLKLLLFSNAQL